MTAFDDEKSVAPVDPRVEELEAALAEKDALITEQARYIADLEADPYRPIVGGQFGEVTDQLLMYEAQQNLANRQAYERTYNVKLDDAGNVVKVEV